MSAAMQELGLKTDTAPGFQAMLSEELGKLEVFNCARHRLTMPATETWIAAGRAQ